MIPRSLIPSDVRLVTGKDEAPPRRLTTLLDERTVVASNLPRGSLDARTSIPSHLPLGVLAARVVVPRDTPLTPLDPASVNPEYASVTVLDHRVTVPSALPFVHLASKGLVLSQDLPDVLEPDVMNTGEINLMVEPIEAPPKNWNWVARSAGIGLHIAFIGFLLLQSRLFPYRPPTQEQIDLARQRLTFIPYLPPDVRGAPASPPAPRSPQIRVDPRVLRQMAPPVVPQPLPGPKEPERVVRDTPPPDLPAAPKPQTAPDKLPDFLRGPEAVAPQPQPSNRPLILPQISSPGRSLEQSIEGSKQGGGGSGSAQFGDRVPGAGGYGPSGGGGEGYLGGGVQMLTPTEGVDFSDYLARVVAVVKRNWESVMPESVQLGEKGRVVLQFRIMRNGAVPDPEPQLMSTSGKPPLDRAAFSSIRTSSPFPPLPSAFSGDFIELRFIFLYNLPYSTE